MLACEAAATSIGTTTEADSMRCRARAGSLVNGWLVTAWFKQSLFTFMKMWTFKNIV